MSITVNRKRSIVKKNLTVVKKNLTTENEFIDDGKITLLPNCKDWAFDFTSKKIVSEYGKKYPLKIEYLNENKGKQYGKSIVFWHKQSARVDKKRSAVCVTESFSWDDKTVDQWANEYACICPRNKKWARRIRQNKTVIARGVPVIEIQPGVDIALFNPGNRIANTEGRLRVGWAGRPDFGINIAADYKGYGLIKKAEEQMPHIDFKYASNIPHEKMPEFYRSIDVLIIASIDEGVPFPLLEAMACGCRIISTDVGIVPEVIMDGARIDKFVRIEKSLIDAIDRIDQNRGLLETSLEVNPDIIRSRWNWSEKVKQWGEVLKCLLPNNKTVSEREDIGEGFLIKNKMEIAKLTTDAVATDKFHIMIPTYNRPKQLLSLLKSIDKEKSIFDITVSIYNDGSTSSYSNVDKWISNKDYIKYTKSNINNGKHGYWKTASHLIFETQAMSDRYFVYLSDDCELCSDFFFAIKNKYDSLPDNKIAMNLHIDKKRENAKWFNGKEPVKINTPAGVAYDIGWIDGAFICTKKFFDITGYERSAVYPDYWKDNPKSVGSMVWTVHWQINHSINKIYRYDKSMIRIINTESVMHPDLKNRNLETVDFYVPDKIKYKHKQPVYAHVCSYSLRFPLLFGTFRTVIDQVDKLFVYLNDINNIPSYLKHPKVVLYLGQNTNGDMKSLGKFYNADKLDGYHFHLDDDIFYPDDYVDKMIEGIERHNRTAVIALLGSTVQRPMLNYYSSRKKISCFQGMDVDKKVDIPGGGTLAYHSDTIKLSNRDMLNFNMDDVEVGRICAKKNVPIYIISRPDNWLVYNGGINENQTIYSLEHSNCERQTEMAKEIIRIKEERNNNIKEADNAVCETR